MRPETQKKLLRAIDRLYAGVGRAIGLDGYDAVMQYLLSNIDHPGTGQEIARGVVVEAGIQKERVRGKKFHKVYAAIASREKAQAVLAALPEPRPETVEWFLTAAKDLPLMLRAGFLAAGKKLPHAAGQSPSLTPEEAKAVRAQIGKLVEGGLGTKEAQRQVAAQRHLSLRTIQRYSGPNTERG